MFLKGYFFSAIFMLKDLLYEKIYTITIYP